MHLKNSIAQFLPSNHSQLNLVSKKSQPLALSPTSAATLPFAHQAHTSPSTVPLHALAFSTSHGVFSSTPKRLLGSSQWLK